MGKFIFRFLGVLCAAAVAFTLSAQPPTPLSLVQTIPMPPGFTHFDHFGVDAKRGRLFATFEDHNTVEVFDLSTGKKLRSIPGFEVPHNVQYVPQLDEIVITDGGGSFNILEADSFKLLHRVKLQKNADFVVYDPPTKLFYVTNGGHAAQMSYALVSIIDAEGNHVGDIKIDGVHIEFLTGEKTGPRIFLNVADKHQVAVIDRNTRSVVANWPLPDAEENLPMALDEANQRLFTVARKPAKLFVLNSQDGKLITSYNCVGDSDDMAYDAKGHRVYVSGGEGYVSAFQQNDPDHYDSLPNVKSGPGGSTSTFAPELNRLYVGVRRGKNGAELQIFEGVE